MYITPSTINSSANLNTLIQDEIINGRLLNYLKEFNKSLITLAFIDPDKSINEEKSTAAQHFLIVVVLA